MKTDRRRALIFGALAADAVLGVTLAAVFHHVWIAFAVFFPAHLWLLYEILSPYSTGLGPLVTRFDTREREVWLTIDDGPAPEETPRLLELLDRHGAKATFFVIGERAAKNPDLVRRLLEAGHTLGNHTATHPQAWFWALTKNRLRSEIEGWFDRVESATQQGWVRDHTLLFRSPVGMKPPGLHPVLSEFGLKLIGWSARGRDGVDHCDVGAALARIVKNIAPGAIVVIHESRGHAPELLERLLDWLSREGYRCVLPGETRAEAR